MQWGEQTSLAEWIIAKTRLHFEHPKVGDQMNYRENIDQVLVSILLEMETPADDLTDDLAMQTLEHETLLCVGIDMEMRHCRRGNVHKFGLAHVPSAGQHVLHAWLQDVDGLLVSPTKMIASIAFTFDMQRLRRKGYLNNVFKFKKLRTHTYTCGWGFPTKSSCGY